MQIGRVLFKHLCQPWDFRHSMSMPQFWEGSREQYIWFDFLRRFWEEHWRFEVRATTYIPIYMNSLFLSVILKVFFERKRCGHLPFKRRVCTSFTSSRGGHLPFATSWSAGFSVFSFLFWDEPETYSFWDEPELFGMSPNFSLTLLFNILEWSRQ